MIAETKAMQAKAEQMARPITRYTLKKCGAEFAAFAVKNQKWTPERANEELSTMSYQALLA